MSLALEAVNRIVDYNRRTVPISGTQIRKDTFAYRKYLHPWVNVIVRKAECKVA
jgi:hypothetical protein